MSQKPPKLPKPPKPPVVEDDDLSADDDFEEDATMVVDSSEHLNIQTRSQLSTLFADLDTSPGTKIPEAPLDFTPESGKELRPLEMPEEKEEKKRPVTKQAKPQKKSSSLRRAMLLLLLLMAIGVAYGYVVYFSPSWWPIW